MRNGLRIAAIGAVAALWASQADAAVQYVFASPDSGGTGFTYIGLSPLPESGGEFAILPEWLSECLPAAGFTCGNINVGTVPTAETTGYHYIDFRQVPLGGGQSLGTVYRFDLNAFAPGGIYQSIGAAAATLSVSTVPDPSIPEPTTWAMMLCGFGLSGVIIRRRRAAIAN